VQGGTASRLVWPFFPEEYIELAQSAAEYAWIDGGGTGLKENRRDLERSRQTGKSVQSGPVFLPGEAIPVQRIWRAADSGLKSSGFVRFSAI